MGESFMNGDTSELVRQWKEKARGDWTAVEILLNSKDCPPEVVCFHCQQFAEKLLKALLTRHTIEAPKTHDLRRLILLAKTIAPELVLLSEQADRLTYHGVETRYPGDSCPASPSEMNEIVSIAKDFGDILLLKLE
jgi:HEPN domain-containing protein